MGKKKNITTRPANLKSAPIKKSVSQNISDQIPGWSVYAVLVFTAMVYARALFNQFAVLDDDIYIFSNPYIQEFSWYSVRDIFSSFYDCNYFPFTMLTFLVEHYLFGTDPLPYHALNVLLHLANTYLVFRLAEKLSGNRLTALIVCVFFAIHPMHVESVAWVAERKDVLYSMFYLISLLLYLEYIRSGDKYKFYGLCLLFFVFSLLSKSAAVTLPVLLVAFDLYKGRKLTARTILEKAPFFLLSLLFGILALVSQQNAMKNMSIMYSYTDRIFFFTYNLAFYVVKLFAPFNLSVIHYFPLVKEGMLPIVYYLSLPLVIFLAWLVYKKTKFRKEKIFGVFFFLIAISVMLQLVPVGNAITAERYTYISYIGFFYIAGQWITQIQKPSTKKTALFIAGSMAVIFSFMTWERIGIWKDANVLFDDVIEKYPDTAGDAYSNRSVIKSNAGDIKGALEDMNKAISIDTLDPEKYLNRGAFKAMLGDYSGSLGDYDCSIKLNPENKDAFSNRALSKFYLSDTTGACSDWNQARELGDTSVTVFTKQFCK